MGTIRRGMSVSSASAIDHRSVESLNAPRRGRRYFGPALLVASMVLVAASILTPIWAVTLAPESNQGDSQHSLSLIPHNPIAIKGDASFAANASLEGWPGNGTEMNPYVISGFAIDGGNTEDCISISATSVHFVIEGCVLTAGLESGVYMIQTSNATIVNNTLADGSLYAVYLDRCRDIVVENNSVTGGTHGIGVGNGSREILLSGNEVTNSSWWSTILFDSSEVTLRDNHFNGTGIQIEGGLLRHWNTLDIDSSNTVDGAPICFVKDTENGTVPLGAGQVILANCTNMTVQGQGNGDICRGIALGFCSNCTVSENNVTGSYSGIYLLFCPSCRVDNNTVTGAHHGIRMEVSSYCRIENNSLSSCLSNGILVQTSDWLDIVDNWCRACSLGVQLNGVSYSEMWGNLIENSTNHGFALVSSNFDIIRLNSFVDNVGYGIYSLDTDDPNTILNNSFIRNHGSGEVYSPGHSQAYDDSGNNWSTGPYGNYWRDWQGPDVNGDGIVDLPYNISGAAAAQDDSPLVRSVVAIPEFGGVLFVTVCSAVMVVLVISTSNRKRVIRDCVRKP